MRKPNKRTDKAQGRRLKRVVGCRVVLSEAEIRHILEKFFFDGKGRYDGQTDKWTYPVQIVGKLWRALNKASNKQICDSEQMPADSK